MTGARDRRNDQVDIKLVKLTDKQKFLAQHLADGGCVKQIYSRSQTGYTTLCRLREKVRAKSSEHLIAMLLRSGVIK